MASQACFIRGSVLNLREEETDYEAQQSLKVPVVDTGENGVFTRGEST